MDHSRRGKAELIRVLTSREALIDELEAELATLRQQLTTAHAEGRAEGLRQAAAECVRVKRITEKHGHADSESDARYFNGYEDGAQACNEAILALAARGGEGKP